MLQVWPGSESRTASLLRSGYGPRLSALVAEMSGVTMPWLSVLKPAGSFLYSKKKIGASYKLSFTSLNFGKRPIKIFSSSNMKNLCQKMSDKFNILMISPPEFAVQRSHHPYLTIRYLCPRKERLYIGLLY